MGELKLGTEIEWIVQEFSYISASNELSEVEMKELSEKMDRVIGLLSDNKKPAIVKYIDYLTVPLLLGVVWFASQSVERLNRVIVDNAALSTKVDDNHKELAGKIDSNHTATTNGLTKIMIKMGVEP